MKITKTPKRLAEPMREVKQLVQRITEADDDELPDLLGGISEWCWPRGDLHYWIQILNRFDIILEETCRDYDLHKLQINEFTPLRKRILVCILKFTRLLVENCTSRKLYASYEHLNNMLFTRDIDVLEATLRVMLRFSQQNSSHHPKADLVASQDKLATLAMTWTPRDHGLEMVDAAKDDVTIPPGLLQVRFQFYKRKDPDRSAPNFAFNSFPHGSASLVSSSTNTDDNVNGSVVTPVRPRPRIHTSGSAIGTSSNNNSISALPDATHSDQTQEGMTIIELGKPSELGSNAMDVLADAIEKYGIPPEDQFELFLKIRLAMSFEDPVQRRKLIICRLIAIATYSHVIPETVASTQLFLYEPEIIPRLAALINPQNNLPDDIVSASLYALDGLGRYRSKLQDMLSSLNASVNHGILLQVLRNITDDLKTGTPTRCDEYVDSYFGLVSFITSTNTGSGLVVGAGLLQLLIKLVDTAKPESYMIQRSVTRAIGLLDSIIYAYVPAFNLFCMAHGLEIFVRRIEEEIKFDIESASSKMDEDEDIGPDHLFGKLTFGRAHLLRAFLQSISHMMQSTGTADGLRNLIDSSLVVSLKLIMENRRILGPQNLALAIGIMATFVHNEPTSLGTIQEKKLPETFLATIQEDVEAHFDVINSIPNAIGALCLNQAGLDMFSNDVITNKLLSLLTSERHSKVLQDQDNVTVFGSSMDELIRHQPTMKESLQKGIFKVLEAIQEAGKAFELPMQDNEDKPYLYALSKVTEDEEEAMRAEKATVDSSAITTNDGNSIAHRSIALADVIMDEADILVRKEDAPREPNLVVSYMDVTCRFLEVMFQAQHHCNDFLRADGLEKLLQFYNLPCLPFNFAASVAADSLVHLLRFMTEINPTAIITGLLREVKVSLEETKSLWNLSEEESSLAKLLKSNTDQQLKNNNDKFRLLVKLNSRIQLLSDVVPAFCYSGSKQPASVILQVLNSTASTTPGKEIVTLLEMGDFTRAWVWESVLFKSITLSTSKALRLSEEGKDAAKSAEDKEDSNGIMDSSNPLGQNTIALRYIATQVKTAMNTFFSEMNKLYASRRSHDSSHRRMANLTSTQIGSMLVKNMQWKDHSNFQLSCDYMIVMISQATKLLYEEKSGSSAHAHTKVLQMFVEQGGLKELLKNYQRFSDELDKYYDSKSDVKGEIELTEEILHICGGYRWACELLSKMVNHAPLLDSPSTAIVKTSNKDNASEQFDPRAFLISMRLSIAPVMRQTWSKSWMTKAIPSIVRAVFKVILKLAEGQGEAASVTPTASTRHDHSERFQALMGGMGSIGAGTSAGLLGLAQAMGATVQELTGHAPGSLRRSVPPVDESRLRQLIDMGFPRRAARQALTRCSNNLSAATEYLLMHPEVVASMQGGDSDAVATAAATSTSAVDGVPVNGSSGESISENTGTNTAGNNEQSEAPTTASDDVPTGTENPNDPSSEVNAEENEISANVVDTPMAESTAAQVEDADEQKKEAKQREKERERESKEQLDKQRGLLEIERKAICETLLEKSLQVCDKYESLVFEARVAVRIVSQSYNQIEPLQELFDQIQKVSSTAREEMMDYVAVRLHLLALIFADKESNALQCAYSKAKDFIGPILSLLEPPSVMEKKDNDQDTPKWMASFLLVLSAILQAEDSIPEGRMIDKDDRSESSNIMPKMWNESSLVDELPRLLSFSLLQLKQATKLPRSEVLALYRFVVTLTRRPAQAEQFMEQGGMELMMKPFSSSEAKAVANCRPFAVLVLRHIIESHPEILKSTIRQEVRSFFCQSRLKAMDTASVTKSLGPAILRNPDVFLEVVKENVELVDYKSGQGIIKLALPDPNVNATTDSIANNQEGSSSNGAFLPPLERGADDSMDLIPPSPTKSAVSTSGDSQMLGVESSNSKPAKEEPITSPDRLEVIVHFLISELLHNVKKRTDLMSSIDARRASDSTKDPIVDRDVLTKDVELADACYFYICFMLQSLTELLSSYKACKISFLTFTEKHTSFFNLGVGAKKREMNSRLTASNSIMAFFLTELIPLGFIKSREAEEMRRLMSISNWAMSTIVALCAEVFSITPDLKEIAGQEVILARKNTLEGIAKAIREASSQRIGLINGPSPAVETLESRYGRLYVLSDLCYRLLKARPNSGNLSTSPQRTIDDYTLHMAKTMLERNFVTVLTSALAEVDLNLPMVKSLLDRILKPLEHLTRVAIKMNKAERDKDKKKLAGYNTSGNDGRIERDEQDAEMQDDHEGENEEDDEEEESENEEEEGREETPDFYRNSSLGMHTGELENAVNYEGDEDEDDEDDEDEEMDEDMDGVVYSDGDTDDSDDDGDDVDEEHIIEVMEEDDDSSEESTDIEDHVEDEDVDEAGSWVDDDDEDEDVDDENDNEELNFVIEGDMEDSQNIMEQAGRLLQGRGALLDDESDAEILPDGGPARISYNIHEVHGEMDDEDEEDEDEGEIVSSQGDEDEDEDGSMLEGIFEDGDMPAMIVPSSNDFAAPADRFGASWAFANMPSRVNALRDQSVANTTTMSREVISPFAFLGHRPGIDRNARLAASNREFEAAMDAMRMMNNDGMRSRSSAPWRDSLPPAQPPPQQDLASHPLLVEPILQSDLRSANPTLTTTGRNPWTSSMRRGGHHASSRGFANFAHNLDGLMGANAAQFLETLLQREGVPPIRANEPLHISVRPGHVPLVTIGGPPRDRLRDNESVVTLNSSNLPAFSSLAKDMRMMDTVLVVQEFHPMPTMSRWGEDMRIIAGAQIDNRLRAMRMHIVNTLRPAWLIIQDALKKKKELQEEERKKAKEAEAAAKAKAKEEEEAAKDKKQLEEDVPIATTSITNPAETAQESNHEPVTETSQVTEGVDELGTERAPINLDGDVEMAEVAAPSVDPVTSTPNLPVNPEMESLQQELAELDTLQVAAQRLREEAASTAAPAESSIETNGSALEEATSTVPSAEAITASAAIEAAEVTNTPRVTTILNGNEIDITDSGIDPTFLEALPEDMREEVLNQHFRERRAAEAAAALAAGGSTRLAASSRIAPEFLEALPPEIRAEVIQQEAAAEEQRRRREERRGGEERTTTAGPSDIDTASFLATLNPDLRGSVLLEQDSSFLESMPEAIRQEVEALRRSTQQSRESRRRQLYGSSGGPGSLPVLNAAVGSRSGNTSVRSGGALNAAATSSSSMGLDSKKGFTTRDAIQLLDKAGIAALVRLLFFPQMDSSSSGLREVLVNLSENAKSRFEVLNLLLMILAEGASAETNAVDKSYSNVSGRINKGVSFQTPSRPGQAFRRNTATTSGVNGQAALVSPSTTTPSTATTLLNGGNGIMNSGQAALIAPLSRAGDEAPFLIASRSIETLVHLTSANEQAAFYFLKDDPSNLALMKWFKRSGGNIKGKEREKVTSNAPINILLVLLAKPSILANAQLVDSLMTLLHTVTRPLPSIVANRRKAEDAQKKKDESSTEVDVKESAKEKKDDKESLPLQNNGNKVEVDEEISEELPQPAPQISEERMAAIVKPLSISISSKGFQNTLAVASNLSSIDGALNVITSALQREANAAGTQLMSELDDLLESLPSAPLIKEIESNEDGEEADRSAAIESVPSATPSNSLITVQRGGQVGEEVIQPISSPALTKLASPSSSQTVILRSLRALEWVLTRPKSSSAPTGSLSSHNHHQHHHHHHQHNGFIHMM